MAKPGSNPGSAPYEACELGKFFNLFFNLRSPREVRETQREGEPRGRQPVCGDLRSQAVPETRGPRIHHLAPLSGQVTTKPTHTSQHKGTTFIWSDVVARVKLLL